MHEPQSDERSTRALLRSVPQRGRLQAILVREDRRGPVRSLDDASAVAGLGLVADHRTHGREPDPQARRQVTLIQAEHLPVIAGLVARDEVAPQLLRRNLVVAGINLASLRDRRFSVGEVELEGSGWCHPCSRMEEALGPGGYQAVRGHGGITARVLTSGRLYRDDVVVTLDDTAGADGHPDPADEPSAEHPSL